MIPPMEIINLKIINAAMDLLWDALVNPEKSSAYNPPLPLRYTLFEPNRGMADILSNHLQVICLAEEVKEQTKLMFTQGGFEYAPSGQKRYE